MSLIIKFAMQREKTDEYFDAFNRSLVYVLNKNTYQSVTIKFPEVTPEYVNCVAKLLNYKFKALCITIEPRTMLGSTISFNLLEKDAVICVNNTESKIFKEVLTYALKIPRRQDSANMEETIDIVKFIRC